MKALQMIEHANDAAEAESMMEFVKIQIGYLGARILAPSPSDPKWRLQAFFADVLEITDAEVEFVGLRRVFLFGSFAAGLGILV